MMCLYKNRINVLNILRLLLAVSLLASSLAYAESNTFQIPENTWIAKILPGKPHSPYGAIKDLRFAFNAHDHKMYLGAGDWQGTGNSYSSGRQDMYTYHVGTNTWERIQPFCLGNNKIQPSGPDELGWIYDTKRQFFWMLPGFQWKWQKICSSSVASKIMTYNPRTKLWDSINNLKKIKTDVLFSNYDSIKDQIVSFIWDGGHGASVNIINLKTLDAKNVTFWGKGNTARIDREYSAIDVEGRRMYAIDGVKGHLYALNLDTKKLEFLGNTPVKTGRQNSIIIVWDSQSKVLLWPRGSTIHIYDPSVNRWKKQKPALPEGIKVRGNSIAYDPHHNVMLYMGGKVPHNPYVFLYRYSAKHPN